MSILTKIKRIVADDDSHSRHYEKDGHSCEKCSSGDHHHDDHDHEHSHDKKKTEHKEDMLDFFD